MVLKVFQKEIGTRAMVGGHVDMFWTDLKANSRVIKVDSADRGRGFSKSAFINFGSFLEAHLTAAIAGIGILGDRSPLN